MNALRWISVGVSVACATFVVVGIIVGWRRERAREQALRRRTDDADAVLRTFYRVAGLPSVLSHVRDFADHGATGREYFFRVVDAKSVDPKVEHRFWALCDAFPGLTSQSDDPGAALGGIVTVVYRKVTGRADQPPMLAAMIAAVKTAHGVAGKSSMLN